MKGWRRSLGLALTAPGGEVLTAAPSTCVCVYDMQGGRTHSSAAASQSITPRVCACPMPCLPDEILVLERDGGDELVLDVVLQLVDGELAAGRGHLVVACVALMDRRVVCCIVSSVSGAHGGRSRRTYREVWTLAFLSSLCTPWLSGRITEMRNLVGLISGSGSQ